MNAKTKEILMKYVLPVVLIVAGAMWVFLGVKNVVASKTWPEVTSKVSRIEEYFDASDDTETTKYHIYVEYKVEGKTYEAMLDEPKSSYKEGDEVVIRYNPNKPEETSSTSTFGKIILLAFGGLVFVIGIVMAKQTIDYNKTHKKA